VIYDTLDPDQVAECYRSGVKAIVSRRISVESLCDTLDKILDGGEFIDSDALEAVLQSIKQQNNGKPEVDSGALTRKEQKIAYMIATTGKRNKEIADDLSMTEQVVKNHLRSIYVKMNVDSRIQLALKLLYSDVGVAATSTTQGN
jgi:DNA-binding NarL/FixJ family response regulator